MGRLVLSAWAFVSHVAATSLEALNIGSATEVLAAPFDPLMLLQTGILRGLSGRLARESGAIGGMVDGQTQQILSLLDADKDGKVGRDEIESFTTALGIDPHAVAGEFAGLDGNGDGTLEIDEIAAVLHSATTMPSPFTLAPVPIPAGQSALAAASRPDKVLDSARKTDALVDGDSDLAKLTSDLAKEIDLPGLTREFPPTATGASGVSNAGQAATSALAAESAALSNADINPPPAAKVESSRAPLQPDVPSAQQSSEQLGRTEAAKTQVIPLHATPETLHVNATALLRHAEQEARESQKLVQRQAQQMLQESNTLEKQASQAEMQASTLRARAEVKAQQAFAAIAAFVDGMAKYP